MNKLKKLKDIIIKLNAEQDKIAWETDGPEHSYADGQRHAFNIVLNEIEKLKWD